MKNSEEADLFVTADDAKDLLGITTREGVVYMIKADQLPGSRKANPKKKTSPWLIPISAIKAHPNYTPPPQKKRGQPAKTD